MRLNGDTKKCTIDTNEDGCVARAKYEHKDTEMLSFSGELLLSLSLRVLFFICYTRPLVPSDLFHLATILA